MVAEGDDKGFGDGIDMVGRLWSICMPGWVTNDTVGSSEVGCEPRDRSVG